MYKNCENLSLENKNSGVDSMEIVQSNTTKDGKYEILSIFQEKQVQSNTPEVL